MSCYQKHVVVANHISDKDLYPEYVKNYNSITKYNFKMGKGFERHFSKEEIQMASKHLKRCPPSPIIREMQMVATLKEKN